MILFQFYVVHLSKDKELLSENEIASQFAYILNDTKNDDTNFPVGLMTGVKRDWWAATRDQLLQGSSSVLHVTKVFAKFTHFFILQIERIEAIFH